MEETPFYGDNSQQSTRSTNSDSKGKTLAEMSAEIDRMVANAGIALEKFMSMNQEQVDKVVHAMALAGLDNHVKLARMAVEETGRGVLEDKIIKNLFATEYIWNSIKHEKTVGVIEENDMEGYVEVAEPVGIVAGVTPVTNPTSTTLFKSLICIKTRNPVIFGFHPFAQKCSAEAARIVYEAAIGAGAPEHCIQWISAPNIDFTKLLMGHCGVSMILATGGPELVKSAYSAGKPALGVGAGNVPCYIEKTANLRRACTDLMLSKTFDNGMICASEQAVIVDREIHKDFEQFMKDNNCHFASIEEIQKLSRFAFDKDSGIINQNIVGQSANWIANQAGFEVPPNTKIIITELPDVGHRYPLSKEKLSPILAYYVVDSPEQGIEIADKMLSLGGLGHTAVIHSRDKELINRFGQAMRVGRVVANTPSSQGAIGDIYNTNIPSLTLGCGSYGRNSTTSNVSSVNLFNKKRLAERRVNMQWFKVPPKIYFEEDSVQYLQKMDGIERAFIVTDPTMVKLGYVEKILYYLRRRTLQCHYEIYSDIEPDPDVDTIMKGVERMRQFAPNVIIALGGGSVIDAAKGMWLFYEHPETTFDGLKKKFMDIRKRAYTFPKLGEKAKLVAIPTTSGTGSEVTAFSVITDRRNGNIKYPLADYSLTPDVAIIDPQFVRSLPASVVADTGMDVLTHAIEAYVSVMASDYTDGLAINSILIVNKYLPLSYSEGETNYRAREKMHNASCIAGMAFTNAFLGLNHSMAHKLGGEFRIPHGRANAILLPHIIEYNSKQPTKFATFPKYERFVADEKLEQIARLLGVSGKTREESIANLCNAIRELIKKLNMPLSIRECGISEEVFMSKLPELASIAHQDQCTGSNPRYPLISEIEDIYRKAYYG